MVIVAWGIPRFLANYEPRFLIGGGPGHFGVRTVEGQGLIPHLAGGMSSSL